MIDRECMTLRIQTRRLFWLCLATSAWLAHPVFAHDLGEEGQDGQTQEATATEPGMPCKDNPCCPPPEEGQVGVNSSGDKGHTNANAESAVEGSGSNPIHLYTGRKFERAVDLVVDGVFPIRVVRMYDSRSTYDSPLGYGWSLNLFQGLYRMRDNSITVRTRCGAQDRYYLNPSDEYELADSLENGRRPALVELPDPPGGYEVTAPGGQVSTFDAEGRLTSMADPEGNELRFTYAAGGRLPLLGVSPFASVPDKVMTVAKNHRLERVEEFLADGSASGRFITLAYDEDIDNPDPTPDYVGSGRLLSITASDGRVVSYDHEEPAGLGAPTAIYNGSASPVPYRGNLTRVTGLEGIVSEYQYDDRDASNAPRDVHNMTLKRIGEDTAPFWIEYNDDDRVVRQIRADLEPEDLPDSDPRRMEWTLDWTTYPFEQPVRVLERRIAVPKLQASLRSNPENDTIRFHQREVLYDATGPTHSRFVMEVTEREAGGDFHSKKIYERAIPSSKALVSTVRVCSDSACSSTHRETDYTYSPEGNLKTRVVMIPDVTGSALPDERFTERWTYVGNWVDRHTFETGPAGAETVVWAEQTTPEVLAGTGLPGRISALVREGLGTFPDQITNLGYDAGTGLLLSTTLPSTSATAEDRVKIQREYFPIGAPVGSRFRLKSITVETQATPSPGETYSVDDHLSREFEYDSRGFLSKVTDARGNVTNFVFDDLGRITEIEVEMNANETEITRFGYSGPNAGLVDPEAGPPGRFLTRIETGATGGSSPQPGIVRYQIFDALGNLVEVRTPDPDQGGAIVPVRTALYDSDGNLQMVSDAGRSAGPAGQDISPQRRSFVYDTMGRVVATTDDATEADGAPSGNRTEFEYDVAGNRKTVRNIRPSPEVNRETFFTFDALDRLRLVDAPDDVETNRLVTQFDYDVVGNVTKVTEPGATGNRTTTYVYDSLSRLEEVQQPDYLPATPGANFRTTYAYDQRNRLYRLTNARSNVLEYRYEPWGGLSSVQHFDDLVQADAGGAAPRAIEYSYDLAGNILSTADSELGGTGEPFANALPAADNSTPGAPLLANRLYTFNYDARNRVTEVIAHFVPGIASLTLDSDYDARGNRTTLEFQEDAQPALQQVSCYDARDRLTSILPPGVTGDCGSPGAGAIARSYYPNDDLKGAVAASGVGTTYEYHPHGPLDHLAVGSGSPASPLDLDYGIDDLLDVTSIAESINGGTATTQTYEYDQAARLTTATFPSLPQEDYTYDARGNREVASDYAYDDNNRITKGPNRGYVFDEDGNLLEINDGLPTPTTLADLTFSKSNRLRMFDDQTPGGAVTSYIYDPFGRRIRKAVSGGSSPGTTIFVWDGDRLIAEYDETSPTTSTRSVRYVNGVGFSPDQLVVEGASPETYDVHSDHIDKPLMLTDSTGVPVWRASYAAFGAATISTDPDGDGNVTTPDPGIEFNIRFPGQYYDEETGLHYNRHRYYDPGIGRYVSADPIGQFGSKLVSGVDGLAASPSAGFLVAGPFKSDGALLYHYAGSNPVNATDPMGLWTLSVGVNAAVGLGFGGGGGTSLNFGFDPCKGLGGLSFSVTGTVAGGAAAAAEASVGFTVGVSSAPDVSGLLGTGTDVTVGGVGPLGVTHSFDGDGNLTGGSVSFGVPGGSVGTSVGSVEASSTSAIVQANSSGVSAGDTGSGAIWSSGSR